MAPRSQLHRARATTVSVSDDDQQHILLDDDSLVSMAMETKHSINWRDIMLSVRSRSSARWERENQLSDFGIWTREQSHKFEVLAVGVVPGSIAEILDILNSSDSEQDLPLTGNGSILHRVDMGTTSCSELAELTVKRMRFRKRRWRSRSDEWCYLDAVHHRRGANTVVEKLMTGVPSEILDDKMETVNALPHVVCGYLLRAGAGDTPVSSRRKVTRVSFYAAFENPVESSSSTVTPARYNAITKRLVKLARAASRLTTLVRRERLGLHVLADVPRFKLNSPCSVCSRVPAVTKVCRVCAQGVCGDCSAKHERVYLPLGACLLQITHVRVCGPCIERIDEDVYTQCSESGLLGAYTVPDDASPQPYCHQQARLRPRPTTPRGSAWRTTCFNYDAAPSHPYLDRHSMLRPEGQRSYRLGMSGSTAEPNPEPEIESQRLDSVRPTASMYHSHDRRSSVSGSLPSIWKVYLPRTSSLCSSADKHT